MTTPNALDLFERLAAPLPFKVKPGQVIKGRNGGFKAMALPYLERVTPQIVLDEVVGAPHWQTSIEQLSSAPITVKVKIDILVDGNWIAKEDIGTADTWPAAATNGFKRAAELWGIGRFLKAIERQWVECDAVEKNGKPTFKKWCVDPVLILTGEIRPERPTAKDSNPSAGDPPADPDAKRAEWLGWWEAKGITERQLCRFTRAEPGSWNGVVFKNFREAADRVTKGAAPVAALGKIFGGPG